MGKKSSSQRSESETFRPDQPVQQPSRRRAALNKSYTEYADLVDDDVDSKDSDVTIEIEDFDSEDDFKVSSPRKKAASPRKKRTLSKRKSKRGSSSPKKKKATTNNNVAKEAKVNTKSEYFMPGDLILSIGKRGTKYSNLIGIKNDDPT